MVLVTVPATTANIGSAFDCAGIALTLYNTVEMALCEKIDIASMDGTEVPSDERNLVYIAAKALFDRCKKPLPGLYIRQRNPLPMARGLGSSSACIAAGLTGANALLGEPLGPDELLDMAAGLEGHPDNVAPALLGGAVICARSAQHIIYGRIPIKDLFFTAIVPPYAVSTAMAREALPKEVPLADAVYNESRAALLAFALCNSRWELLGDATSDRLHQRYRAPLIEGCAQLIQACRDCGAKAVFISGSGPTIMAVSDKKGLEKPIQRALSELPAAKEYRILALECDERGARAEAGVKQ